MDELVEKEFITRATPVLDVRLSDTLHKLFTDAIRISMEQRPKYQQVLSGIISNIIGYALYLESSASLNPEVFEKNIESAKSIIQEDFKTVTPKTVADSLGLGYSNFRMMFKKYTGTSPAKYIKNVKIANAKNLLTYTEDPVKVVAMEVGIDNIDYFSTLFKAETGFSPLEYRNFSRGIR